MRAIDARCVDVYHVEGDGIAADVDDWPEMVQVLHNATFLSLMTENQERRRTMLMTMRILLLCLLASTAMAQSTSFTLGTPTADCIAVTSQDGIPTTGGDPAYCPDGFFGDSGLQIWLLRDPLTGESLTMYSCVSVVESDTGVLAAGAVRTVVSSLACPVNYPNFSVTWTGGTTFTYNAVYQSKCVGRFCHRGYVWVYSSASGQLSAVFD